MRHEPLLTKGHLPLLCACLGYLLLGLVFALAVRPAGVPLGSFTFVYTFLPWAGPLACFLCYREFRSRIRTKPTPK